MRHSIAAYDPREWDCIIFYYALDAPPDAWSKSFLPCVVVHGPGLSFGDWMLRVTPAMVESSGYTHITIHINDVQYREGVDPASIVADMHALQLDVASPNVIGSVWPSMCRHAAPPTFYEMPGWLGEPGKLIRPLGAFGEAWLVRFIEIQITTFTASAWACWWEMLNPGINPLGYEYDLCFFHFCMAPRMGILGDYTAVHWGKFPGFAGGVPTTNPPRKVWNDTMKEGYRGWLLEKWRDRRAAANEESSDRDGLCMG